MKTETSSHSIYSLRAVVVEGLPPKAIDDVTPVAQTSRSARFLPCLLPRLPFSPVLPNTAPL